MQKHHKWCGSSESGPRGSPFSIPSYLYKDLDKQVLRNFSRFRLRAHHLRVESCKWHGGSSICDKCNVSVEKFKMRSMCFLAKPQSWGEAPRFDVFPPKFTTVCAGPPSPPAAPKTCTVTQTHKSCCPVVSGGGEGQGMVLLGTPRNEIFESWESGPGQSHTANVQVWNLAGRPSKTFFGAYKFWWPGVQWAVLWKEVTQCLIAGGSCPALSPAHALRTSSESTGVDRRRFWVCLQGPGPRRGADGKFAAPCKHTTGCTDFHNSSCKGL